MPDQAKHCPICGSEGAVQFDQHKNPYGKCAKQCEALKFIIIPLELWNSRPIEDALANALLEVLRLPMRQDRPPTRKEAMAWGRAIEAAKEAGYSVGPTVNPDELEITYGDDHSIPSLGGFLDKH